MKKFPLWAKLFISCLIVFLCLELFDVTNFTNLRLIIKSFNHTEDIYIKRDFKSLKAQATRGAEGKSFQDQPGDSPEFYKLVSPKTGEIVFYGSNDFDLTAFFFSKDRKYKGSVVFKFEQAIADYTEGFYRIPLEVYTPLGEPNYVPKDLSIGFSKNGKLAIILPIVLGKKTLNLPMKEIGAVDTDKEVLLTFEKTGD